MLRKATDSGRSCFVRYFTASKGSNDPARAFTKDVVNPWDESAKHDVHPSQVAAFKYRYRNREDGSLQDSMPTLNSEVRNVSRGQGRHAELHRRDWLNAWF